MYFIRFMSPDLMHSEKISSCFDDFLKKNIDKLRVNGVFDIEHKVDSIPARYEDYLTPFGPNGGYENIDPTIKHIANLDNLGRFAVDLEQTDARLLETIGIEGFLPADLPIPDNCACRPGAPWKTLNAEIQKLYQAVGLFSLSEERVIANPSVSQTSSYIEGMVRLNKAASVTFRRFGLEDAAKHFAERAEVLDSIYDQILALEGRPTKPTAVGDGYDGDDFFRALAAEHVVSGKQELPGLDAYLIMVNDPIHPRKVPGFKTVCEHLTEWNKGVFALGERNKKTLELMTARINDRSDLGNQRYPYGFGFGPYYNAVGEIGFTRRDGMLIAMYMHFSGELAKEFSDVHPDGVTYLTWLFEPDFEPTGTLTREQMLNSEIVKIPSWFVAGETDRGRIFEGMNWFVFNMIRLTGLTHKMYDRPNLKVLPTLYSDLSVDNYMADIVMNYMPGQKALEGYSGLQVLPGFLRSSL